ncbi:hypothetical protein COCSADRAFT_30641 [Bipolaris sorokiniana ND90Pr]|uniref:DUF7888 domain-containing protein n=1 Tax=Cochliobolus sativus (strain ND90Pr / ATCC 201652) TaxID=665912 RepID=M2SPW5_COCSN|nr:uncharacterized protein COCSADRAFT_30641 [Bipolaris sorokiniana ND90Pr]EMD59161.1 hypothetical protein COCSADRAFT_30641 [Bipolaris sorokiniana ND90Pr]
MRFTVPLIVMAAALTNAAAIPEANTLSPVVITSDGITSEVLDLSASADLDKRQTPSANAQVIGDHSGSAGQAVGRILNAILNKLFPLKDWNPARETFTRQTTALMYQNNPDRNRWVATVCYNKGWDVKDRRAISDVVSMKLSLGAFHTDYDCMYIGRHNQFYTQSDGGYINLAFQYDSRFCSYDGRTADLTCN